MNLKHVSDGFKTWVCNFTPHPRLTEKFRAESGDDCYWFLNIFTYLFAQAQQLMPELQRSFLPTCLLFSLGSFLLVPKISSLYPYSK